MADHAWRVQGDTRGLDELVAEDGGIHLESMGARDWFLSLGVGDRTIKVWFTFNRDGTVRWANTEITDASVSREMLLLDSPTPGRRR